MSLRGYLMGERVRGPLQDIAHETMRKVCQLTAETAKVQPDAAIVSALLDDLDVLAADYRREEARTLKE